MPLLNTCSGGATSAAQALCRATAATRADRNDVGPILPERYGLLRAVRDGLRRYLKSWSALPEHVRLDVAWNTHPRLQSRVARIGAFKQPQGPKSPRVKKWQ